MNLYAHTPVWKRTHEGLVVHQLLQSLETGLFYVQSKDTVRQGDQSHEHSRRQFCELLQDLDPRERTEGYATAAEAIAGFDAHFG